MNRTQVIMVVAFGAVLGIGGWVAAFHEDWLRAPAGEDEEGDAPETVVPVHVTNVSERSFHRWVEGWGRVTAEPAQGDKPAASARVASPASGVLSEARCAEGEKVEKGDLLFQLDTRMASAEAAKMAAARTSARASVNRLEVEKRFADRELERARKLAAAELTSEKELHAAELAASSAEKALAEASAKVVEADRGAYATQTQASLLRIKAPLSGTVVKVNVNPGESVEASTVLAEIVDLDRLVVTATIPAGELPRIQLGQNAHILRGETDDIPGRVAFIGLSVDTTNDSVPVRLSFDRAAGLHPGEYVHVRVMVEEHPNKLGVPRESLVETEKGPAVAVVEGDHAHLETVTVGLKEGQDVEIAGPGLSKSTRVVSAGAYGLPKETKIRIVGP